MEDYQVILKSGEHHWPEYGATVRWEAHTIYLDFKVHAGDQQDDGSVTYNYFNEHGGQEFTEDFTKGERYVEGSVKWDGCSHLNFGDGEDNPGYLHMCGGRDFKNLGAILREVFLIASREVPQFDAEIGDLDAVRP
jgi:hypothetical protein